MVNRAPDRNGVLLRSGTRVYPQGAQAFSKVENPLEVDVLAAIVRIGWATLGEYLDQDWPLRRIASQWGGRGHEGGQQLERIVSD